MSRELTRQSSFERMERMMSLTTAATDNNYHINAHNTSSVDKNKAAYDIQQWYLNQKKFRIAKKCIQKVSTDISVISKSLNTIKINNKVFSIVQRLLSDASFVTSLTSFLSSLPLDPTLQVICVLTQLRNI